MPFLKTPRRGVEQLGVRASAELGSFKSGLRRAVYFPGDGRFVGEWEDNLRHGKGAQHSGSSLYEGDWHRDQRHGYGVLSRELCEGSYAISYAGGWAHGKQQGRGVRHYPDGGMYEGGWEAGARSGHGRMWFPDHTFYEGGWLDDTFHGLGLFVQADGNRYEGRWERGARSGYGRYYHLGTGQLQRGLWRDGVAVQSTVEDIAYRQSALHPTPYPIPKVEVMEPNKIVNVVEDEEEQPSLNSENNRVNGRRCKVRIWQG
ncbi:MORN repeat-containing protein 3 [Bacillus rossius redtenbacheri]|uniref:MORN repeat-containing protein 3 n=1 Tax=Bacillus rossius redtenbacheri TaxID=93214 RepID=UPI002FDE19C6